MTALVIVLAAIILLGATKVGISAAWRDGLSLRLRIGPLSFDLLKEKNESKPKKTSVKSRKKKKGKNPWVQVLLKHWREVLSLISRVLREPKLEHFSLKLIYGGKDQADAALNYGKACAAAGILLPFFKSLFQIDEKNIHILYDANGTELKCTGSGAVTVRVYRLVVLTGAVLRLAYRLYRELPNSQKVV